ncbi:MAG: hypothetical protein JEZ11_06020 [Desulfobacterales bacterium]|nr:hypothetical protein [Desulfobacterales bacterium]
MTTADSLILVYLRAAGTISKKEEHRMQSLFSGLLDCVFMAMVMALTMMVTLAYGI